MSKLKVALTLLFSALGIFGANEYYKPRNIRDLLKWKGIKLASDNRAWKSMFFENEEELKGLQIYSENALWTWCSERFKSTNLDDEQTLEEAKKYCADNATSIMGRIIKEGEDGKVIKSDDYGAFAVNYVLTGYSQEVLDLVKLDKKYKINSDYVSRELSKWCEAQKRIKITSQEDLDKFGNFKKRCYNRGVKTVSQLLSKQGLKPMTGDVAYSKRFTEELKNAPELIKELKNNMELRKKRFQKEWEFRKEIRRKSISEDDLREEEAKEMNRINTLIPDGLSEEDIKKDGGKYFKWWCEDRLQRSLTDQGIYPTNYAIIKYRCTEKTT